MNSEIDNTFENIENELELRFHSIENELDQTLEAICSGYVNKRWRLTNKGILKSQVGFIDLFGDYLNVKSIWFGKIKLKFDNIFLKFPKLLPVANLLPESNEVYGHEIYLRCADFRDGVLYTSGISITDSDAFLFRIHSQKTPEPEEFKFKCPRIGGQYSNRTMLDSTMVGHFFVLDNNNVYFYDSWKINQIGDLGSRTFSKFVLAFQEFILDLYVNDKYFIAKTYHNFLFHEKTTTEYLYKISLNFHIDFNFTPHTIKFVNESSFSFIGHYFVQILGVEDGHVYFNLISLDGEVRSKTVEFKKGVLNRNMFFLKVIRVVKNCFWFRDPNFHLFKIQF